MMHQNIKSSSALVFSICLAMLISCRPTRQIKKAVAPREIPEVIEVTPSTIDSTRIIQSTLDQLTSHYIDYRTFSAKIKVDVTDNKGKQPEITAIVRVIKDSAIWMSLSATFLNIEVYRVLIKPNQVILLNKQAKQVQYRTLDYLTEVTEIPFDFQTLQDLIVGNPVFFNRNITSFRQFENQVLITSVGDYFKHLMTLSTDGSLLLRSKLDDVDISRNRTADITYDDYNNSGDVFFSTSRRISVSEKNRMDIKMNFKQYEFNKELSVTFNVPKNYKKN